MPVPSGRGGPRAGHLLFWGRSVLAVTSQSQDWVKGKGKRLEVWVGDETLTPRPSRFEGQWGGQVLKAGNSDPERG